LIYFISISFVVSWEKLLKWPPAKPSPEQFTTTLTQQVDLFVMCHIKLACKETFCSRRRAKEILSYLATGIFTISAEILARSLANFYGQ